MIYNIWRRRDSAVLQYLVPNSKREKYIASLSDERGAIYTKIGTTAEDTPPPITGGGDMFKATYDKDNNNIVDRAEVADAMNWTRF